MQPIVALLYTDFDVLGFHRTASAQKQTTTDYTDINHSSRKRMKNGKKRKKSRFFGFRKNVKT